MTLCTATAIPESLLLLEGRFVRELSEIVESSLEEAALLLDVFTRNASRVFSQFQIKEGKRLVVTNPMIRSKLLGNLLNTEAGAVMEIAKGWLAQESLINQGRRGITTLFE